ncbi:MAG: type II toxin-antitoxin system PemK/MazF family toxin [Deferrisomatales bacterium]
MRRAGQIAVLEFPRADLVAGKPRPVLLLARLPGPYDDWLVAMVSTQLRQAVEGFDEVIAEGHEDYGSCGLRTTSVVRIARLAVVQSELLVGAIGEICASRLTRIRERLTAWIREGETGPGSNRLPFTV